LTGSRNRSTNLRMWIEYALVLSIVILAVVPWQLMTSGRRR